MGTLTLWDRIWPWLRHPLDMTAGFIAVWYINRHDLTVQFPY